MPGCVAFGPRNFAGIRSAAVESVTFFLPRGNALVIAASLLAVVVQRQRRGQARLAVHLDGIDGAFDAETAVLRLSLQRAAAGSARNDFTIAPVRTQAVVGVVVAPVVIEFAVQVPF